MDNTILNTEEARIQALKKYDILDTPPDGTFDEITKLAAELLNVPIAIISMVDTDRVWFKSKYGLEIQQIDRDPGLCASAILSNDFYEVENAINDPRTMVNPLVYGKFGLRFFAAYPLETKDGYNLGTFCVMDKNPRKLNTSEKNILKSLTKLVMNQIELRHAARTVASNHNRVLDMFTHDLKNPLATINMSVDVLQKKKDDPEIVVKMSEHIKNSSKRSLQIIQELLDSSELDSNEINLRFSSFNMAELLREIVEANQIIALRKKQTLKLLIETQSNISADKGKITEIINNLINNAIKYSPKQKQIFITLREKDAHFIFEVKDEGPGLTVMDKEKIFKRFSKLSAQPTGNEISTGLGLYIVKSLVEAHKGEVWAESEGKNKGATFRVRLPITSTE